MMQNNLLNSCQSGFKPNDSCINQLISVTHIYCVFDANPSPEVQDAFLDFFYTNLKQWGKRKCSSID